MVKRKTSEFPYVYFIYKEGIPYGFRLSCENDEHDLLLSYHPKDDTEYYLLYVIYTESDSESTYPEKTEIIDMYETFLDAEENAKNIRLHYTRYQNRTHFSKNDPLGDVSGVNIKLANGVTVKGRAWIGAMESLDGIFVASVKLTEKNFWEY